MHKCTNTLYDYVIINFNTYVSLIYELKKLKVFTSKFAGNGPSSCEKRIYRAAVSQRLRNTGVKNGKEFWVLSKIWKTTRTFYFRKTFTSPNRSH